MRNTLILFAVTSFLLIGCNRNNEINPKYLIEVCGKMSPDWLIDEIDGIIDNAYNYRPVKVFSINYENTNYVIIMDITNSSIANSFRVFLCSGNSVQYGSDTYVFVQQMYIEHRESFNLLWSNSNTNN